MTGQHAGNFDAYALGLADGRRAVEAELAAERFALSELAAALAAAWARPILALHPDDCAMLPADRTDVAFVADTSAARGTIAFRTASQT
jgi:hypothetical protein